MKAFQTVLQLIALGVAGTFGRVYSDRIYFETDISPEGTPTTVPPWSMQHTEAAHRPSASKGNPRPPSSAMPQGASSAAGGFQPIDSKFERAPELVVRTTMAAPETTTMAPYTPGILDNAVNAFTLNMETLLDTGKDLLVFSPLSIAGALTMVLLGARGQTLQELAAILGVKAGVRYGQDGTDLIHEDIASYFQRFEATSISGTVRFANGVFLQEDLVVSDLYVRNVGRLYTSEVQKVNFRPRAMVSSMQVINNWVSNRTEGHLKRILSEPLPAETSAVFVNVIYFQGEWEHPFCTECVRPHNFYVSPDETVQVDMMTAVQPAYFNEDKIKGYKILGLPYKDSDLVMYFILPKTSPKQFLEGVQVNDLTSMINNATMNKEVIYIVPKMKLESTLDLVEPLRCMGLKSIFTPSADLRGISQGIYINSVLQKVEIEITETGTKAVVSTIISATRSGHRPSVRLDKPFIFMVYKRSLRTIVFWGTVYKPTPYREIQSDFESQ